MKAPDLANLFMQAPVAICIVSGPQYIVELVNERMLQFLGRTEAILGKPLGETLTEAKEQGLLAILDRVRSTGESFYTTNFPSVILINGVREPRYFNLVFKPYYITPEETKPSGIFCVAHHVTEAVLAQQKLEEEKKHTVLALETGELGMLSTNWENKTVTADKRALEIFGFSEMQPIEAFLNRLHPEDLAIREKALEDSITTGFFDFEVRLNLPGNKVRWLRSRGTVQRNAEAVITGSFGVVQDVTAQKEHALNLQQQVAERTAELEITNKTLQQLNADLLRSNAALEEFARAASHDLKEPVRKIQVFASRLRQILGNRLTEDEKMIFERMENAAGRMALLVDDLLEYSHLNHSPAEPETIDLNEKISRILSDLELLVAEKEGIVEKGNLPTVKGYRRQLEQLFQNLLTNALKYSRQGVPPRVHIHADVVGPDALPAALEASATHKQYHRIQIADNGIGFHPEEADKIFQVFTRLHGKEKYAGTGIGLSIAKKVAENHEGFIYAEGEPGKGATFTVLLPA
ncbi:PAS domain-containing protein [Flavisolibacter sp. BT320]|nr:PAS domain-containing protein [Flavisolibacter longurius]